METPITLPSEKIHELRDMQRRLADLTTEIDKFENCGNDCQSYRAAWQEQWNRIESLLSAYTPKTMAPMVTK